MKRVLFRHKFIAFWVQHQIYHKHRMALQHFSIAQDRVGHLTSMIRDVLESGSLNPAMVGKLWGRLGFSCTRMFGRVGRAKLRPFSRRQHEHRKFSLNHHLTSALKWWLEILSCSPPCLVPTDLSARRRIVSYSDGEGSEAGTLRVGKLSLNCLFAGRNNY